MEDDYGYGDYDPEFDEYVRNQVAERTCSHSAAWNVVASLDDDKQRESCYCPDCGTQVTFDELAPSYHEDWAESRAERAMEQAAEDRMYGVRD